ncbi:tRNA lysidine(34) synthetase TilS [Lewinellaceae bacterium SD302]|nr:tRNA lysidine(34) synthetase TilS [Lewinellaceae bacterium SD302]
MSKLADKMADLIQRERLFQPGDQLLLAVSGGLDSVVLLHALKAAGYPVEVAHYNYRLRGAESEGDAEFVAGLAKQFGCSFWLQSSSADESAALRTGNLQATARQLRYDWLQELKKRREAAAICTAHHLDDNLETLLLQLTRGTSLTGLTGMQPKLDNGLTRPLLNCSREEIENYARIHQLPWREDGSNATDKYNRNRLRHHVIPYLTELQTDGYNRLSTTFERLRQDESLFRAGLDALWENALIASDRIDRKKLPNDPAVALQLLYYKLRDYGFKGDQFRQILTAKGGTELVAVGGDWTAHIRKGEINISARK